MEPTPLSQARRAVERRLLEHGLDPAVRLLVLAAVAVVDADWPRLCAVATVAQARQRPRADVEETLLQAILFCGFPRVITAFEHLDLIWPTPTPPAGGSLPVADQRHAGRRLFASIYGPHDQTVRTMLRRRHAELHDFVLDAAYGRILSRPHLDARRRELLAVGMLVAQDQPRQFTSHARGAMHVGATRSEVAAVIRTARRGKAAVPWLQQLVRLRARRAR